MAALLLITVLCHARAGAADVVIVKSSEAEPYVQAESAVRDKLGGAQNTVHTFGIKEVAEKGIDATIGKTDIVIAVGTASARWLHKQLGAGPALVYCMVNNPEDAGLFTDADCWGVTTDVTLGEQFKLIGQALPDARTIGVLYRSDAPESRGTLEALKAALPAAWRLEPVAVNDFPSVAAAIDALTQKKIDLIWTAADAKLYDTASVRALLLSALRNKIPVWGFSPAFVRAGALLGVGVDPRTQGGQAGDLALKLIADPHSLKDKVQPPREYQLAVNLIVAEQLGVEIPDTVTKRAAYVFRPEK